MKIIINSLKTFIYILLVSVLTNCHNNVSNSNFNYLKSIKKIFLPVNNHNEKFIGYMHYEDDMNQGPSSIFVYDKYIYLLDSYHENIKKINITTGKITSTSKKDIWLTDIFLFKNKLIAPSELPKVLIYNLNLIKEKELMTPKGYKIFIQNNTHNNVFLVNFSKMLNEDKKIIEGYHLDSLLNNKIYSIKVALDSSYTRVGFFNTQKEIDGKKFLKVGQLLYEIPHSLNVINEYEAKNIFVEPKRITYFNFNKKRDTVFIEIFNY